MTKEFFNLLKELGERDFNVAETLKQMQYPNKMVFWSWGANAFRNISNKGLLFRVKGREFTGFVYITLNWNDVYKVRLISVKNHEIVGIFDEVYCDVLQDTIDEAIEKQPNYTF